MEKKLIAVIDDEKSIQKTLSMALENEGYSVCIYDSATDALDQIKENLPDLIILDIMMPGIDGITFCSMFRRENPNIPIIFLSSRTDELSKIEALERGGDDYLTKPFSIKELLVRISVSLRRVKRYEEDNTPQIDKKKNSLFEINDSAWEVHVNNNLVNFSVTEFRIFTALFNNSGIVFTREQLMEKAYPQDVYISDRNVDTHITRIRKKITAYYPEFNCIESVYGLGYRFKENRDEKNKNIS